jgi:hypothetical protein
LIEYRTAHIKYRTNTGQLGNDLCRCTNPAHSKTAQKILLAEPVVISIGWRAVPKRLREANPVLRGLASIPFT